MINWVSDIKRFHILNMNNINFTSCYSNNIERKHDNGTLCKFVLNVLSTAMRPGAKTINVFRACLGAQLTICAQK